MIRILATDGMDASAVDKLTSLGFEVVEQFFPPEQLKEAVKEFDAMVVRSATKVRKDILDAALETGRLKLVIRGGVGIDNIDSAYAKEHGITVNNTPAASSASVAELAIGHMFSMARNIGIANATMRNGEWNKKKYEGIELSGKTLGLIGFGRIAKETAKKAEVLGMNVLYTRRSGEDAQEETAKFVDLDTLIKEADFISLHIPKQADRDYVIGKEEIAAMKDGVFLINTARGGLIEEDALCDALDAGKVSAAALDVFREEPCKNERILHHPKISMTPHIGAATKEAQMRIGGEIVQIIEAFFGEHNE
ncbi:D-3-phosphoglycerate dehydrogenase [Clostridiaceae bacterium JG1575]|nr:D-3-phosphoglycerate dehydrogenase [Clostridiaceae bacterium JG1575]